MAKTPETKAKDDIKAYLDSLGPACYHRAIHNVGYGRKGVPDRLCCYRGVFFGLEVKAPGGTATPWQKAEIAAIVDAGGIAEVVYNVEDVIAIIAKIDSGS